jgi:transposase
LLTSGKLLQRKIYDIENDLRGSLRNFGLHVGVVGSVKFEERVRELVADHTVVAAIVGPLLEARAVLRVQFAKLHRMLLDLVQNDPICRRLMSAPGVGSIVALTFRTCVDNRKILQIKLCRRALRAHPTALSIGRGRPDGTDLPVRERDAAIL